MSMDKVAIWGSIGSGIKALGSGFKNLGNGTASQYAREVGHMGLGGALGATAGSYFEPVEGGHAGMVAGALAGAGLKSLPIRSLLGGSPVRWGDRYVRGFQKSRMSADAIDNAYLAKNNEMQREVLNATNAGKSKNQILDIKNKYQTEGAFIDDVMNSERGLDYNMLTKLRSSKSFTPERAKQLEKYVPTWLANRPGVRADFLNSQLEKLRTIREGAGGMIFGGSVGQLADSIARNLHMYGDAVETGEDGKKYYNMNSPFTYMGAIGGALARISPAAAAHLMRSAQARANQAQAGISKLAPADIAAKTPEAVRLQRDLVKAETDFLRLNNLTNPLDRLSKFFHNTSPQRAYGAGRAGYRTKVDPATGKKVLDLDSPMSITAPNNPGSQAALQISSLRRGLGDYENAQGLMSSLRHYNSIAGSPAGYARFALAGFPAAGLLVGSQALGAGVPAAANAVDNKVKDYITQMNSGMENRVKGYFSDIAKAIKNKAVTAMGFRNAADPNVMDEPTFNHWQEQQLKMLNDELSAAPGTNVKAVKDKVDLVNEGFTGAQNKWKALQDFGYRNKPRHWLPYYWFNPVPPRPAPSGGLAVDPMQGQPTAQGALG